MKSQPILGHRCQPKNLGQILSKFRSKMHNLGPSLTEINVDKKIAEENLFEFTA